MYFSHILIGIESKLLIIYVYIYIYIYIYIYKPTLLFFFFFKINKNKIKNKKPEREYNVVGHPQQKPSVARATLDETWGWPQPHPKE